MRQIPVRFEQDCSEAEERLFPSPSQDPERASTSRRLEGARRARVARLFPFRASGCRSRLRGLQEAEGELHAGFSSQPRGVVAERSESGPDLAWRRNTVLDEPELSQAGPMAILTERDLAKLQIHFYAALQQWLVEMLDTA